MANNHNVLQEMSRRPYEVKGSVAAIEVGDYTFLEPAFQGNTTQITLHPASAGSVGSSAAISRQVFADKFAGVAYQRHDLNSFDKNMFPVVTEGVAYNLIYHPTGGTPTPANVDVPMGAKVGIATTAARVPINQGVVINGVHSTTVADNEAIGYAARRVRTGDARAWVHFKSMQIFSQTGV